MPHPVILINSLVGNDTNASGAGPAVAISGSNAVVSSDGLTITLDGSPDLSSVLTDGSHAIFINDSQTGARNFSAISAKNNSIKTVDVISAFRVSASGLNWAIGGKRQNVNSITSSKLFSNNNSSGDAMPGWTIRMESGHTESGGQITMRRAGNTTDGYISLEGDPLATVRPLYVSSSNGIFMNISAAFSKLEGFDLQKSGSSDSIGISFSPNSIVRNCRILNNSGVKFATGIQLNSGGSSLENVFVETVTGVGITTTANTATIRHNVVLSCGSFGIELAQAGANAINVVENIVANCASDGFRITNTSDLSVSRPGSIEKNIIHNNTGDGIRVLAGSTQRAVFQHLLIENNHITKNGGFGINFSGSSITDELVSRLNGRIQHNNFGLGSTANASGICNFNIVLSGKNNVSLDPGYFDAINNNYSMNANMSANGYPVTIGAGAISGNISYVDIGPLQRQLLSSARISNIRGGADQ